ncbi:transposase, partial [Vibrio splendidus]
CDWPKGEWKVKKNGTDGKRRVWRKLHIAVDTNTHEIIGYGLQTEYSCYSPIPKALQINGWKY